MARCSRGAEGDVKEFARRLRVIETFGEHSERERLDAGDCFVSRGAVAEHAGQVRDFGNPAAIRFALQFNFQIHALKLIQFFETVESKPVVRIQPGAS